MHTRAYSTRRCHSGCDCASHCAPAPLCTHSHPCLVHSCTDGDTVSSREGSGKGQRSGLKSAPYLNLLILQACCDNCRTQLPVTKSTSAPSIPLMSGSPSHGKCQSTVFDQLRLSGSLTRLCSTARVSTRRMEPIGGVTKRARLFIISLAMICMD